MTTTITPEVRSRMDHLRSTGLLQRCSELLRLGTPLSHLAGRMRVPVDVLRDAVSSPVWRCRCGSDVYTDGSCRNCNHARA